MVEPEADGTASTAVADAPVRDPGTLTLAVTTFDRPASALARGRIPGPALR